MARDLGVAAAGSGAAAASDVAPARRGHRPAWRDPRLWVGVVLVAASVVAGARLLAAADDTVQVWAAAGDLGAGQRLAADDLTVQRVRFADERALGGYLVVDGELPGDLELTRDVAAGELLPREAVGAQEDSGLVEVPVAVEPELVPPGVEAGDVVDVYVTGRPVADGTGAPRSRTAGPALRELTVVDAPLDGASFGASGRRQLVVAVAEADAPAFFALLAEQDAPTVTVVRRR